MAAGGGSGVDPYTDSSHKAAPLDPLHGRHDLVPQHELQQCVVGLQPDVVVLGFHLGEGEAGEVGDENSGTPGGGGGAEGGVGRGTGGRNINSTLDTLKFS